MSKLKFFFTSYFNTNLLKKKQYDLIKKINELYTPAKNDILFWQKQGTTELINTYEDLIKVCKKPVVASGLNRLTRLSVEEAIEQNRLLCGNDIGYIAEKIQACIENKNFEELLNYMTKPKNSSLESLSSFEAVFHQLHLRYVKVNYSELRKDIILRNEKEQLYLEKSGYSF